MNQLGGWATVAPTKSIDFSVFMEEVGFIRRPAEDIQ